MKGKLSVTDKISLAIILADILGVIGFMQQPKSIIMPFLAAFVLYSCVGMWLSGLVGIAINIVSIVNKVKSKKCIWINIIFITIFILTIPLWKNLFDVAMSV